MMAVDMPLPDDLFRRLTAAAAERGMTVGDLLAEAVDAHLARPPSFIGIGASGRGDLSEQHKGIRRIIAEGRAREA
jgi:hypothetical protein